MTFNVQGWGRSDRTAANPIYILSDGTATGTFKQFNYYSADTLAVISADGYFDSIFPELSVGDIITVYSSTDLETATYYVSSVNPLSGGVIVVIEQFNFGAGEVTTAQFANGSVTYAKIQDMPTETLLGNSTGIASAPSAITVSSAFEWDVNFLSIAQNVLLRDAGTITAADWNNMYAVPIQVSTGVPPFGYKYALHQFYLRQIFGTAQYINGGAVAVQYGNAVHGAGPSASQNISAATINSMVASSAVQRTFDGPVDSLAANGEALFLSNGTAPFAAGDGTWEYYVYYRLVPV